MNHCDTAAIWWTWRCMQDNTINNLQGKDQFIQAFRSYFKHNIYEVELYLFVHLFIYCLSQILDPLPPLFGPALDRLKFKSSSFLPLLSSSLVTLTRLC